MDTVNDPEINETICMMPSQVGKTESGNNIVGYYIHQDPCPILYVMPTLDLARAWSKERFSHMVRDTPVLNGKVNDLKTRDSDNAILTKAFPGGHLTIAGANSPASLASRPIRVVIIDEEDRFRSSAGREGDPTSLAKKRQATFWNKKLFRWSSPGDEITSKIEPAYERSNKQLFYVPCPKCDFAQILLWGQVKWEKEKPETAYYLCQNKQCNHHWTDAEKIEMEQKADLAEFHGSTIQGWQERKKIKKKAGFWLNGVYSPWLTWQQMAEDCIDVEKSFDVEEKKVWVNTFLCETWKEAGLTIEPTEMATRREPYGQKIPRDVLLLTAAVDVQDDRLEIEVLGWGLGEETWGFRFLQILHSPSSKITWKMLDEFLKTEYEHELGIKMHVAFTCIDSGGHFTQQVYNYCRPREAYGVYAIKGSNTHGKPIINRAKRVRKRNIQLLMVGTDTAKSLIYKRLLIDKPGPEYMHFPLDPAFGYDEEYFKQLTAEKAVNRRKGSMIVREWVKIRQRNEALDLRVYNMASFYVNRPKLEDYQKLILKRAEDAKAEQSIADPGETRQRRRPPPGPGRRKGWIYKGWK